MMPDREKVIREFRNWCEAMADECPVICIHVLDLLEEQEPCEPEKEHSGSGVTWWNVCGNCKTAINPNDKYCHECGRAVKWDA
jgi:hypothetical protein